MTVDVMIGNKVYSNVTSSISFAPEVCLTCTELPIGQVSFDIKTDDTIQLGTRTIIYRNNPSNPYAAYWVTSAVRNGETVKVVAQSALYMLDTIELEAEMFDGITVNAVVVDIFEQIMERFQSYAFYIHESYLNTEITGYCPKQSARERLLWVCLAIGAYVDTSFTTYLCRIMPISTITHSGTVIPMTDVFYNPQVAEEDFITAIKITAYSYREGTPSTTDKWVEAEGVYYIETQQEYTLTNPNIPVTVTDNPVVIDSVKIINTGNVNSILSLLSLQYFNNKVIDAEILHRSSYGFGSLYKLPVDENTYINGYVSAMDFVFGNKSNKAKITLRQTGTEAVVNIIINALYNNTLLKSKKYYFPTGVLYSIENAYIDKKLNSHRYVFIPDNEYATGTVSSGLVDNQQYDVALDYYSHDLYTISVDGADFDSESGVLTIE